MIRRKLIFIFNCFLFLNCIHYISKSERLNLVRVAIVCNVESVTVTGIKQKHFLENYGISINDAFPIYFQPKDGRVIVNSRPYRGNLEIKKIGGRVWVINVLNIEDYLKGVVPCEIGKISPNLIEAAKAQAVAARTYAYAHYNQYQELGFDLHSTIQDQVYAGINVEDELINSAIKETKGAILVYQNRPVEAKYHSTCGGKTADFTDAWPGIGPPYLKSVDCPYCIASPHYQWQKVSSKKEFFINLRARLTKLGISFLEKEFIKGFELKRNVKSNRVIEITIITTENEYSIETYNIRTLLGDAHDPGGLLKANYFDLQVDGDSIIIEGKGWGHGVGMCQFGAIEMARQGKNYKQILLHYYPGTKIVFR